MPRARSSPRSSTRSSTPPSAGSAPPSAGRRSPPPVVVGTNLVVVRGELRTDPEIRSTSAGEDVVDLDLIVRTGAGPAESVPVRWVDTGAGSGLLRAGLDVVVVGRVRRRFFRVGGATATRTEVHADAVVPARAGVTMRRVVEAALERLGGTDGR